MKYLSDYTEEATTKLIKENGGFFAFSDRQFNENKKEGVKYVRMYGGLIAPKENVKAIHKGLQEGHEEGIVQDMKDHTIRQIIFRDCANYELQLSYDGLTEIIDTLKEYPIKKEDIIKYYNQFIKYCNKNDLY